VKHIDTKQADNQPEAHSASVSIAPGEIIIGSIMAIDAQGQPLVSYHGNPGAHALIAVSTLAITKQHTGRQAALLFANGDPLRPVIMGLIHSPLQEMLESYELAPTNADTEHTTAEQLPKIDDIMIDGKRIVLEGKEEIVLKCGEASITLTKAGKILIRGKYLLNRAEGVNRILGGSVQVN
jgi:hypothetical protein